jgi:uncharacterized repeat protein (TIGR03803 family)
MSIHRSSIELRIVLGILSLILFATSPKAVAQQEKLLHSFAASLKDGSAPNAGLIFDAAGNLYGTTTSGVTFGNGTVYELTPTSGGGWKESILHIFGRGKDGQIPYGALIFDASGDLYGTTILGGAYGGGTVFELTPSKDEGWTEKVLHDFDPTSNDGFSPFAGVIFDALGNLFGTTTHGGAHQSGTVFELTPAAGGAWTETVIHDFDGYSKDGYRPYGLISDTGGNLYGTTDGGGAHNGGTVFELTPQTGGAWKETILHDFAYNTGDGLFPYAGLALDTAGNLYGTTDAGGIHNQGTVFAMKRQPGGGWTEEVLHSFFFLDGRQPVASVIFDAAGNLYGTTSVGGSYDLGVVFELSPKADGSWTEKILYVFGYNSRSGEFPDGDLILDAAGNLYGTTYLGGLNYQGAAFEITP